MYDRIFNLRGLAMWGSSKRTAKNNITRVTFTDTSSSEPARRWRSRRLWCTLGWCIHRHSHCWRRKSCICLKLWEGERALSVKELRCESLCSIDAKRQMATELGWETNPILMRETSPMKKTKDPERGLGQTIPRSTRMRGSLRLLETLYHIIHRNRSRFI